MIFNKQSSSGRRGFSLIEVILAVGIFAFSIVAVLALLGTTSRATSDVLETTTASRIADGVRSELDGVDLATLDSMTDPTARPPLTLVATKDGHHVRIAEGPGVSNPAADNDPENGDPPGITDRDRFYRIEVRQLEDTVEYDSGSAAIAVSVRVIWPHHVRVGANDFAVQSEERQSMAVFNTAILRKE